MSSSDLSSPLRAHLLVEGERYAALECSEAGISLTAAACHSLALGVLRRGDECPATLILSGLGGEEVHEVTVRLAARGPAHVEFAFAHLPPEARARLRAVGPIRAGGPADEEDPDVPGVRRIMLHLSEAVVEATRRRRSPDAPPEPPATVQPDAAPAGEASIGPGWLLLVAAAVVALAVLSGILLFR